MYSIQKIGMIPGHLNSFKFHVEEGLNLFDLIANFFEAIICLRNWSINNQLITN